MKCICCSAINAVNASKCGNCGHALGVFSIIPSTDDICEANSISNSVSKNKIYTLAYNNIEHSVDEQMTYLIDEDKKTKLIFYTDGYDGLYADQVKNILDFLGIKYFECVYTKLPEKYENYESYRC